MLTCDMRAALFAPLILLCGCATQGPAGGRAMFMRYEPFARAAATREIPSTPVVEPERPALTVAPDARDRAVTAAHSLLGKTRITVAGKRYGDDCTGFVRAVYEPLGVDLMTAAKKGDNGVTAMWRFALEHGRVFDGAPSPGDLVFFKETYDLNRDGRVNDGLTHIGVVEAVEKDGTVLVIHRVARGVVRYRMNLAQPTVAKSTGGRRLNDWLRTESPGSKPKLTGELFAGFATLLPETPRVARR